MKVKYYLFVLSSTCLIDVCEAQSPAPYISSSGLSITTSNPATYSSPSAGQGPGLIATESYTGSPTSGFPDLSGSSIPLNLINIGSDTVSWQPTAGGVDAFEISHLYGGTSNAGVQSTGSRNSLLVSSQLNGPMPAQSGGNFYVAGQFSASTNAVLSNPPSGQPWGDLYGLGVAARTKSGATNWGSLFGMEIDMAAEKGSSAAFKVGLKVTSAKSDVWSSSDFDAGIALAAYDTNTGGWSNGISFGDKQGKFPIVSTGTMIGAIQNPGNSPATQANLGIDFSQVAFTTAAFRSPGFTVDGSGNVHSDLLVGATNSSVSIGNDGSHDGLVVIPSSSGSGTGLATISASGSDPNTGVTIASKSAAANKGDINLKVGSYNALNLTADGASQGNYFSIHTTGSGTSPYITTASSGSTAGMGFRVQGVSNFDFTTNQAMEYLQVAGIPTPTSYLKLSPGNSSNNPQISTGGTSANLLLGSGTSLATAATNGFILIPTVAGLPTGAVGAGGQAGFVVDTTDSKLCANWGSGWKCATLQ